MKKFLLILLGGCSFVQYIVPGIEDTGIVQSTIACKSAAKKVRFPFLAAVINAISEGHQARKSPDCVAVQDTLLRKDNSASHPTPQCSMDSLVDAHPTPPCSTANLRDHLTQDLGCSHRHPTPKCSLESLSEVTYQAENRITRSYSTSSTDSYCIGELPPPSPQFSRSRTHSDSTNRNKFGYKTHLTPPTSPKIENSDE